MDTRKRVRIDAIAFTGPERAPTVLSFQDGVNIVWGASNSGKSFVRKSIDYVLGGEKPTIPPEGKGYDNYVLWLTLPGDRKVSLRCSALGGDILKADGHMLRFDSSSVGYETLSRRHVNPPNISRFLLNEVGFRGAQLLKNERAEKSPFSLRVLMRYLIVDETRMIDEKSILLAHNATVTSEDKGLIRFLLTGIDGSSVEQVRSTGELKAARDGKIELLSQMTDELRRIIDDSVNTGTVRLSLALAEEKRENLHIMLAERQELLDKLTSDIRDLDSESQMLGSQISELRLLIVRFSELSSIYASDIERLRGLEEGSFLLQRFAGVNCPLCGAAPSDQTHDHGLAHVEDQRRAVEAEIAKISADTKDLHAAIIAAENELAAAVISLRETAARRSDVSDAREAAKKLEFSARQIYADANATVKRLEADVEARENFAKLQAQIDRLRSQTVRSRYRAEGIDVNLDLTQHEAHELSQAIQKVLVAWNYPGGHALHFARDDHDIVVDGKRRRDNGAGVRALLHAAFKVGVLEYCLKNRRPHPGFMILDSPLLAFRPAEESSRYGELQEDEVALRRADVARHFYRHLQNLAGSAQFIIIENHKSDQEVVSPYANYYFTLNPDIGRVGLFT